VILSFIKGKTAIRIFPNFVCLKPNIKVLQSNEIFEKCGEIMLLRRIPDRYGE